MSYFTLPDGRHLAYTISQLESSKPVILLSNSLCVDYTSWDRITPVIEELGFRVLRYDQPGHGRSSTPPSDKLSSMTFDILANDVRLLLENLGINRIHAWIGVSLGAITGIYFAATYRGVIHKLIVADAVAAAPVVMGGPELFSMRVEAAKAAGSMDQDLRNTARRWFGDEWIAANPKEMERMMPSMNTTTIEGLEACCAALSSPSFDLTRLYPSVGAGCDEAFVIVGQKDADLPLKMKDMRSAIEQSLVCSGKAVQVPMEVVENAGHVPYIDGLERFCQILKGYL